MAASAGGTGRDGQVAPSCARREVRVHGPRVTAVQVRTRRGSVKADLAAIGPQAILENTSACRTRSAQDLCGLLRVSRGEPALDTARFGVGALLYCIRANRQIILSRLGVRAYL